MIKNKAAIELEKVIIAILLLVVLFVLIVVFTGLFGDETDVTSNQISCINSDEDGDGVNDLMDRCCKKGGADVGFDGCPDDATDDDRKEPCNCERNDRN